MPKSLDDELKSLGYEKNDSLSQPPSGSEEGAKPENAQHNQQKEDPLKEDKPDNSKQPPEENAIPQDGIVDLKELGGKFKTKDELVKFLTDADTAISGKQELEKIVDELRNSNPFADETLFKLNALAKEDPEKLKHYASLVYGKNDPIELLKAQMKQRHPDKSEEFLEKIVKSDYPNLYGDGSDPESIEYQKELLRLESDAKNARGELLKKLDEITVPKYEPPKRKTQEEEQKEAVEHLKQWTEPWEQIVKGVEKLVVPVSISEKENVNVEIDMKSIPDLDKQIEKIAGGAAKLMLDNKLNADKENIGIINEYVKNSLISQNFNNIVSQLVTKFNKEKDDAVLEAKKGIYNPSGFKQDVSGQNNSEVKHSSDEWAASQKFKNNPII